VKSKGLEPWIHSKVDDEACPINQIHGRNQRKTPQIVKPKIRPKIPSNITKNEKHCSSR
jgi:hypothetical protein